MLTNLTDRNMTDIKMPADEIASVLRISKDDEIFTGAMNALAELANSSVEPKNHDFQKVSR